MRRSLVFLNYELLGFLGGAMITFGLIPQTVRLFKLKSAREISLPFTLLYIAGTMCWLIYGISLSLLPVILWNSVSIVLLALLLYAKLKYRK
jgi:MtN3 and saliva related transmembrane protein